MDKERNFGQNAKHRELPAIVLAAFGTTHAPARAAYDCLEDAVRTAFPDHLIVWAYTSPTVRNKLAAQGKVVGDAPETLERLAASGHTQAVVLSAHVLPGEEFHKLCLACQNQNTGRPWPERVEMGLPLLAGSADLAALAAGLVAEEAPRLAADEGVLLIGHGAKHGGGSMVYPALQYFLDRLRLSSAAPAFFVTVLEGSPGLEVALQEARARGIKHLNLVPLMAVAGEHIMNDVLGEGPESILNRAVAAGFTCRPVQEGLLQRPCARDIWLAHLKKTLEDCAGALARGAGQGGL